MGWKNIYRNWSKSWQNATLVIYGEFNQGFHIFFPEMEFQDFSRLTHYDGKAQSYNPGLQYPHLHGPVHTPDNNRWDTPPV